MQIEPIGILAALLGLAVLAFGPVVGIYALAATSLLGAAAAIKLPALGDASIMPCHLIIPFLMIAVLRSAELRGGMMAALTFPRAGFWFLAAIVFGAVTAVFLPRIFAGATMVYSLTRSGIDVGVVMTPLGPRASNITQTAYLLGDVACYAAFAALIARGDGRHALAALLLAAGLHLAFALLDLATFATGTGDVLGFIRNANYRMLNEGVIGGFKRIVGSFTEAGAYAYVAIGFYAFCLQLWLRGVSTRLTGALAAGQALALLLSTSSAAYAAFGAYNLVAYAGCLRRAGEGRGGDWRTNAYLVGTPVLAVLVVLGLMLIPSVWTMVTGLFDATVSNKMSSQSGVERARWNAYALQSAIDTLGMGAGVGSVRASSFLVALVSNVGVVGTLLYGAFLTATVTRSASVPEGGQEPVRAAARGACLATLLAATVTLGSIDLGLFFVIFAALATTAPEARAAWPAVLRPIASGDLTLAPVALPRLGAPLAPNHS
ncbi:hypothetical protein [Methylobacterium oxalidis]|uniref:Uncharacterized protein n=1 Tax=Methylobacterium oxalidis TaxID=944322 RepID=A0A512IZI5_9HYPH|nr:hypothetical protein [Methylobacterium oxalidis]GEP03116.1 hypothetical protein MOX02_11540 [Methylobacterium oxalidis]GJE31723.1 hypothetical protein LDDCCGHA_1903 [Methylobacterium oxalidis]GLS67375.1 hypothetical protein GCM10007888_57590 [Methylobacterium oxalidis]